MRKSQLALFAVACACTISFAQKQPTGSVTGHVTCADTNTPARLASVVLRPVAATSVTTAAGTSRAIEARQVHTLLDGSFTITGVSPGTYFVLASMPGYMSPLASLGVSNNDLLEPSEELAKRIAERVPAVTVEANASASVNISLERGAAVGGTVLFDDGSPAAGVQVHLMQHKEGKWAQVQTTAGDASSGTAVTDDRGNYRMSGLPAMKEALVKADLNVASVALHFSKDSYGSWYGPSYTLAFYSGSVFRTGDATPFELTAGEERPGEDITLPLAKLHKVQGAIIAHHDGHVLNKGSIALLFADDKSNVGDADVDKDDATFSFPFVPEGDFILRVKDAADARYEEVPNPPGMGQFTRTETKILQEYGAAEMPLHVQGERAGVTIDVPDKAAPDKAAPAKALAQQ
jgi:hypothetical protein